MTGKSQLSVASQAEPLGKFCLNSTVFSALIITLTFELLNIFMKREGIRFNLISVFTSFLRVIVYFLMICWPCYHGAFGLVKDFCNSFSNIPNFLLRCD